ncbi:MAG: AsmA family protein [Alphaproteobacteria bacterium]
MKKIIISLCVFLVLAVAAILVVPGLVDWNEYKQQVAARVGAVIGLDVAIDGDMDFAVLPTPHLSASGVRIVGDVAQDMASVAALEARVALLPLLTGRIQVERVVLVEPVLVIEVDRDGDLTWIGDRSGGGALPRAVQLDRVTVENGTLIWRDLARGNEWRVESVDLQLAADTLAGPFQASAGAIVGGVPVTAELSTSRMTATGALPLTLTLGLGRIDGAVRFAGIVGSGRVQGELIGETGDIAGVIGQVLSDPPLGGGAHSARFEATLRADPDSIALTALTLELGETRASGAVEATWSEGARVDLALAANRVDLEALLATAAKDGIVWRELARNGLMPLGSNMPFSLPTGLTATVDLAVDAMSYRGGLVRQARLEAALSDGTVAVSRFSAQLPGGSDFALTGTLRSDGGVPHVDASARAAANDLRGVLDWLGLEFVGVPNARLRRFSAAASIVGTPDEFQIAGFDVTVDGTRATGGLAYVDRGRPGVGLRLDVGRLSLDSYRPPAADSAWWSALAERLPTWLQRFDANVDATVSGLTVGGLIMRDLRLDGTLDDGALTLRQATIGGVAGASIAVVGSVATLDPVAGLDLRVDLTAPGAGRLARSLGIDLPVSPARLGALSLAGRLQGDRQQATLDLTAEVAGGTVQMGGTVIQPLTDPVFDLAIRATHPDLAALATLFADDYRPVGPLGGLDIYGEFAGTVADLTVDNIQGTVGPVALAGKCAIVLAGPRPRIEAELRAGEIVLDPWLQTPSPAAAARPQARWSREPFDLAALGDVDGALSLTSAGLALGGYRIGEPALRARLQDGDLELTGLTGRLFGGTLGLSGRLVTGVDPPTGALNLDLVGANLAEALGKSFDVHRFDGGLDFGLDIETTGSSAAAMVASLDGGGLVAVRDGAIEGFDLRGVSDGLEVLVDPLAFVDVLERPLNSGTTSFASLNATFRLTDGIARWDDLRLVAEPGIGRGSGTVNLPRWQVDLTTEFELSRLPAAPAFGVRLIGRPEAPERVLETSALQTFIARRAADALPHRFDGDAVPLEEATPAME